MSQVEEFATLILRPGHPMHKHSGRRLKVLHKEDYGVIRVQIPRYGKRGFRLEPTEYDNLSTEEGAAEKFILRKDCADFGPIDFTPFLTSEVIAGTIKLVKKLFQVEYANEETVRRCAKRGPSSSTQIESCIKWQIIRYLHSQGVDMTKLSIIYPDQKLPEKVISSGMVIDFANDNSTRATIQDLALYPIVVY